jgi:hypothetical protein
MAIVAGRAEEMDLLSIEPFRAMREAARRAILMLDWF